MDFQEDSQKKVKSRYRGARKPQHVANSPSMGIARKAITWKFVE
jgi:hypothetical protein